MGLALLFLLAALTASPVWAQQITVPPNTFTTNSPATGPTIAGSTYTQLQSEALANYNILFNSTTTIAKSIRIPAIVAIVEVEFQCTGCTAYINTAVTVGSGDMAVFSAGGRIRAKSHEKISRSMKRAMDQGHEIKHMDTGLKACHNAHCESMYAKKASMQFQHNLRHMGVTEETFERRREALRRHTQSNTESSRHLLQFDAASFALATYAVIQVHALWNAVNSVVSQVNGIVSQIAADEAATAQQFALVQNEIDQVAFNSYLQNGVTAMNALATEIKLRALDMKLEHAPGWMATMAHKLAQNEGLNIPVAFDISPVPDFDSTLQNSYQYYGLIDDDPSTNYLLNLENPCNNGVYRIAKITEGIFPWGYSMFVAVVYAVWPKAPTMLVNGYQGCTAGGRTGVTNGGCFLAQNCSISQTTAAPGIQGPCDPLAAEKARRVAFIEINFQGYVGNYSTIAALTTYTDKQAFLNAYTFKTYGFTGPLGNNGTLASRPPQCPSNGPSTAIYFPANPIVNATTQCIDPNFWSGYYTNTGTGAPCANFGSPVVQIPSSAPLYPMNIPNPIFVDYPSYYGQILNGFNGNMQFRTLGVSNQTVDVHYLVQQQIFYFNSSSGLSRSPPFLPEWRTADGRSPPDALIDQMYNIGLTVPFEYDPTQNILSPFSYIPSIVYTLAQSPGDFTCYNAACLINSANYAWDPVQLKYTYPFYTQLIAPVGNPVNCYPTYKCETVGQVAVQNGIQPVLCPTGSAVCCNSAGYPCAISFNGTDSVGHTIFQIINASVPNFQQALAQAGAAPPTFSYSAVQAAADNLVNLTAQLTKKFPQISVPGDPLGGFADFLGDIANAAEAAALAVANIPAEALGAFSSLFTGIGGALNTFLAYLPFILIGLIFLCIGPDLLKKFNSGRGGGDSSEPFYSRRKQTTTEEATVGNHLNYESSSLIHPAAFGVKY